MNGPTPKKKLGRKETVKTGTGTGGKKEKEWVGGWKGGIRLFTHGRQHCLVGRDRAGGENPGCQRIEKKKKKEKV